MNSKSTRRKCPNCKVSFIPDPHNRNRQVFCFELDCRWASKAASQRRWLRKPENRNYHGGGHNVKRVQEWRKAHPGYWKRSKSVSNPTQDADLEAVNPETKSRNGPARDLVALQDFALTQDPAFVGLISMVTGSTLQDDIAQVGRNLVLRGMNILGLNAQEKNRTSYDSKTIDST